MLRAALMMCSVMWLGNCGVNLMAVKRVKMKLVEFVPVFCCSKIIQFLYNIKIGY